MAGNPEADDDLHPSQAKRAKTLAPPPAPCSKGKERMEKPYPTAPAASDLGPDAAEVEEKETCGVCLADVRRSIRGRLDSCDHCFCFVCIMEWAKIESLCPLCRRRFRSIRRPLVPGVFSSERVVEVAVRDQVYHPLGNESTALTDPYANTDCSICHVSKDEELLLLCDLCDSAAHTYCVALGVTVPEGDWYCPDCTISRNEHSKSQLDDDSCGQNCSKTSDRFQIVLPPVSIYDIVADEITSNRSNIHLLGEESNGETSPSSEQTSMETTSSTPPDRVEVGARTLHNCRKLHNRIRSLRENWTALRAGSLGFSSDLLNHSSVNNDRGKNIKRTTTRGTKQQEPPRFVNGQAGQSCSSSKAATSEDSQDVHKAWKMMEIAKSICGTKISNKSGHSLNSSGNINGPKEVEGRRSCSLVVERRSNLSVKVQDFGKRPLEMLGPNKLQDFHTGSVKPRASVHGNSVLNLDGSLSPVCVHSGNVGIYPKQFCSRAVGMPEIRANVGESSASSIASNSVLGELEPLEKMEIEASGKCQDKHKRRQDIRAHADERSSARFVSTNDTAKNEIQLLVKLNIKLLDTEKMLGAERFKDLARVATHTVLSACGLEHSKSSARPFSKPACNHSEKMKQPRASSLMRGSCRQCFYRFVQEVVNSVISDQPLHRANTG